MTKKIFRSIFAVAILSLLISFFLVFGVLYSYFTTNEVKKLDVQADLIAKEVDTYGESYLDEFTIKAYRITWIEPDGTVIFDNEADTSEMENHADREEVAEALDTGTGESERYSSTLSEKTYYRAVRISDGSVVRVSFTQNSVLTILFGMIRPVLFILIVVIIISGAAAAMLSKRIVGPINSLDLDRPLDNDTYEELSTLLTRIDKQHGQIALQIRELEAKKGEFEAIVEGMNEGLILINNKGNILTINLAARKLFDVTDDASGRDVLTVDRSVAVQELLRRVLNGERVQTDITRKGSDYRIEASPILFENELKGAALFVFDTTEKMLAERQRTEFSANVSHELKTPLHSIMGNAELIENGLVKKEDMPLFSGRIRSEASRLVALIDDIIRLSSLDEGGEIPKENVDLYEISSEVVDGLKAEADRKNVEIILEEPTETDAERQEYHPVVRGVRRLIYEIVYNLCDNAVKYNKNGGTVRISVNGISDRIVFRISDTGIGIAPENQNRVFERFYRVDKSHSRDTGGTGLGLSIVKHAAARHGAEIKLESEPGEGTVVTVSFPR